MKKLRTLKKEIQEFSHRVTKPTEFLTPQVRPFWLLVCYFDELRKSWTVMFAARIRLRKVPLATGCDLG